MGILPVNLEIASLSGAPFKKMAHWKIGLCFSFHRKF
jgi:hypothetical protein